MRGVSTSGGPSASDTRARAMLTKRTRHAGGSRVPAHPRLPDSMVAPRAKAWKAGVWARQALLAQT